MWSGIWHLVVITVAVWAIVTGFRRGFMRQAGWMLAVAFGIVGSRLASVDFNPVVEEWVPQWVDGFKRTFVVQTLAGSLIYIVVSVVIGLIALPLGGILRVLGGGILDSIGGAIFRLFQYLMIISIAFNLVVDMNPGGDLTRSSRQHDGNVVEGVMQLAPSVLGFPGGEEVGHRQQLEDAKKIS